MIEGPPEEGLSTYEDVQLGPDFNNDSNHNLNGSKGSTFGCDICGVKVTSATVLQRHFDGRKHKMRLERQGKTFECQECQVTANSQSQLDAHMSSSRHRNRLLRKEQGHQVSSQGVWVIMFCIGCLFISLMLFFKRFL